ncbi:hypothetical protein ACIRPQ_34945 [Streptomyces sp. NPDC101213]
MDDQVTPLLERIDARERELGTAAEQLRTQIDELSRACVNSTRRSITWR